MLKETLSQTDAINYPLFALILFVLVFSLVTIRVLLRGKRDPRHMHLAALPLAEDGEQNSATHPHKEVLP